MIKEFMLYLAFFLLVTAVMVCISISGIVNIPLLVCFLPLIFLLGIVLALIFIFVMLSIVVVVLSLILDSTNKSEELKKEVHDEGV